MFAEHIREDLYNCLKCAMCQPVCPTYKVTRMERHSPRGRVQMVKHFLEGDLSVSKGLQESLMSCILCESCTTACPSGVRLDRVFENMREELSSSLGTKLSKKALFAALKNPLLMRLGARAARIGLDTVPIPRNLGLSLGNIPLNRLPTFNRRSFRKTIGEIIPPKGPRLARALYFTGCATDLIYEDVGYAVTHVLSSLGIEVVIPSDQVCCSVPIFLSGARKAALPNILRNIRAFDRADADFIIVDCATCGGGLRKGIPHLLEDLGMDPEPALRVAAKVRDVSEVVAERLNDLPLKTGSRNKARVTYHDPCHLVRSMKVSKEPRRILSALEKVNLVEMSGADQCCGGAGSFQFEHIEISAGVTSRKKDNIRHSEAHIVATGCPGCRLTLSGNLSRNTDPKVMHTIQLVSNELA